MSSPSKRKGSGFELEVVRDHQALGIEARKTPLSGALPSYPGDIQIAGLIGECKRRRKGFSTLYKGLAQGDNAADLMFIRDDGQQTLVVLPWETWKLILGWLDFANKYPNQKKENNEC